MKELPSKFTLGGIEWEIKFNEKELSKNGAYGQMWFTSSLINLTKTHNGEDLKIDNIEQTLYHEVTHAILNTLGEHELSDNEEFVQKFSLLLHQFEKSKR